MEDCRKNRIEMLLERQRRPSNLDGPGNFEDDKAILSYLTRAGGNHFL